MKKVKKIQCEGGIFFKREKLKKRVEKIVKSAENKRNFLPLFSWGKPRIMKEKEIKNELLNVAKNYFNIKEEINKNKEII